MGQQGLEREGYARARRKRALSRTCACIALVASPAIGLAGATGAAAEPRANTVTFKGGVTALGSFAAGVPGGGLTFHDPHTVTPPPPPPVHPDHHPPPPPPPDHHPPPPPPPDHHPPPPPPPDHHPPPPPPAAGSSFTFDLPWPPGPQEEKEDQDVLDLALEDDALIETGVTSGSDSSVWDPIHVEPNR